MRILLLFLMMNMINCYAMHEIEALLCQPVSSDDAKLISAIKAHDTAMVTNMLAFDQTLLRGCGLHAAAGYGGCLKILLAHGADPNGKTKRGYTPLHFARKRKSAELLLNAGAMVDIKNKDGKTPLQYVLFDRSRYEGQPDKTWDDIVAITHLLLERGADINVSNEQGNTLLHCALGSAIRTDLLLSHGINAHQRNRDGLTPFEIAVSDYVTGERGLNEDVLKVFEKYGMAFFHKIRPNELLSIPQEFKLSDLNYIYSQSYVFNNWVRLLACAKRWNGKIDFMHSGVRCTQYGCMVNNISSNDLLHYFGQQNKTNIEESVSALQRHAQALIEASCSPKLRDLIQRFPWLITYDADSAYKMMVEAIKLKKTDCLEILLKKNIDLSQSIYYGNRDECEGGGNFLHMAVFCDNPNAIEVLAKYKIDFLQKNRCKKTPLGYAIELRQKECKNVLNSLLCCQCSEAFREQNYAKSKRILHHIVDCNANIYGRHRALLHDIVGANNKQLVNSYHY